MNLTIDNTTYGIDKLTTESSCEIELFSGYSGFNCLDTTSSCYTTYTTSQPTFIPTIQPTSDPTLEPTIDPTNYPSVSPTGDPTNYPSESPTRKPTTSDNIIYVRDYGCDYGYCYNIDGDYTFNCQYTPWLSNANNTDIYQYCCNPRRRQLLQTPTVSPTVPHDHRQTQPPTSAPTSAPTETPLINPTGSPSQHPTTAPSFTPSKMPTNAPTAPPTTAPTYIPTAAPSNAPTKPPTSAPTTPPTAAPTASPTFGPTCKSIDYSWECFHGRGGYPDPNGCAALGYDGNGIFDIGEGEWIFPYNLTFGSQQVVVSGDRNEEKETILKQTRFHDSFIGCYDFDCWLTIQYLTIAGNIMNSKQISMKNEGHLYIKAVVFDGNNYARNI